MTQSSWSPHYQPKKTIKINNEFNKIVVFMFIFSDSEIAYLRKIIDIFITNLCLSYGSICKWIIIKMTKFICLDEPHTAIIQL